MRLAVARRGDHLLEQVGDGDGFAAVRAGPAGAEAGGEDAAVGAALLAVEALPAAGAFVDGELAPGPGSRDWRAGCRVLVAAPPGGLAAGGGAVALPPGGGEGGLADRAGDRRGIVS